MTINFAVAAPVGDIKITREGFRLFHVHKKGLRKTTG